MNAENGVKTCHYFDSSNPLFESFVKSELWDFWVCNSNHMNNEYIHDSDQTST